MFLAKHLFVFVLITTGTCEYYTSVAKLNLLLTVEERCLSFLNKLKVPPEQPEIQPFLESYKTIKAEFAKAKLDPNEYAGHPVNGFKLIKRFLYEWKDVMDYIKEYSKNTFNELHKYRTNSSIPSPKEADLIGAANGIALLQETYGLEAADLAEGRIQNKTYSSPISLSDCAVIGSSLYRAGEYSRSLPWLLITLKKMLSSPSTESRSMIECMRCISVVYLKIGNPKMALLVTNDILARDPENKDALANKELYTKKLLKERKAIKIFEQPPFEGQRTEYMDEDTIRVCRGEFRQSPSTQRPLRCMYTSNGAAYHILHPFKMEQISLDPLILYYHQVLGDKQINRTIVEASEMLTRSEVELADTVSTYRTSQDAWLSHGQHEFPPTIAPLLKDITGLSLAYAEDIQVVNYGIGGYYAAHYDTTSEHEATTIFGEGGNRISTAMIYLTDVELGGATVFPSLNVSVNPEQGNLLLWYNQHESLEVDYRTMHAACPVLKGSKWILTQWFHEKGQVFNRPCSLKQQGHISEHLIDLFRRISAIA